MHEGAAARERPRGAGSEKAGMDQRARSALGAVVSELPQPRQTRSLKTQESFVEAGWEIVQRQPWDSISITDIAKRAKRSVGAFYQRFGSKEDFLSVLLHRWIEMGYAGTVLSCEGDRPSDLIDAFLTDAFTRIRTNRFLWRAALQRAMNDPASWEPFRELGAFRRAQLAERLGELRGRPLSEDEKRRLALGLQVFNSVINNALLNDPGPLKVEDPEFLPVMRAMFRTVSQLDLDA